jgi:NADH-quinone oxidoreductase subunit J
MTALFFIAAVVAVVSTVLVVTRSDLVHALLYLVVSLFAVAVVFFTMGAPFVAALEVIVYAGAIMMLFVFAVMLLNVRAEAPARLTWSAWAGPLVLAAVLLAELIYGVGVSRAELEGAAVGPEEVSEALFGPYVLGVELASMLLLAALVGARHVSAQPDDETTGEAPDEGPRRAEPQDEPNGEAGGDRHVAAAGPEETEG